MQLLRFLFVFGLLGTACRVVAQAPVAAIPEAETAFVPSPQRLAALHAAAQREGWAAQVESLRAAAFRAYEKDKLQAAAAWLYVYRWAALFATRDDAFTGRWIEAVNAAQLGHPNMASQYATRGQPLGTLLAPALQAWLLGNAPFSAEFFALLSPVDYVPGVFRILDDLHQRDPARFKTYAQLALALAVVQDIPPPPFWPHAQVLPQALPRKFTPPAEAFAWFIKQEQLGKNYHSLKRLSADELKFVVDAAAPLPELEWVQDVADQPLNQLARAYTMIRYRNDRVANNRPIWLGQSYRLLDILASGGICADQAYFATQVGKARGVPTLLIYGAGNDGRHAWFGFLDGNQKWQLDAGRYAEQRFVTGHVRDPQTWRELSDHELKFMQERFRELPSFRTSRTHAAFAAEYLAVNNASANASAVMAARKAVSYERRNQTGWDLLATATQQTNKDPKALETVLREAALAFQRYPDLEAYYLNRVADSLRARGQASEAEAEARRIAQKNRGSRGDLSLQQGKAVLLRALAGQPLAEQIKAYHSVLEQYGRGAGIGFFDAIVLPFVQHLLQLNQPAEAAKAVERARRTLKVEPHSQLDTELAQLQRTLSGK